ncbi:MAG: hypothetical protein ACE5FU_05905 [Nitrospinota bacterium]
MLDVFQKVQENAVQVLPKEFSHPGDLISTDGSLIDSVLSMHRADYWQGSKKAKVHLGFDVNHSIPVNIFFTVSHTTIPLAIAMVR